MSKRWHFNHLYFHLLVAIGLFFMCRCTPNKKLNQINNIVVAFYLVRPFWFIVHIQSKTIDQLSFLFGFLFICLSMVNNWFFHFLVCLLFMRPAKFIANFEQTKWTLYKFFAKYSRTKKKPIILLRKSAAVSLNFDFLWI